MEMNSLTARRTHDGHGDREEGRGEPQKDVPGSRGEWEEEGLDAKVAIKQAMLEDAPNVRVAGGRDVARLQNTGVRPRQVKILDTVLALAAFLGLGFNFSVLCQTLLDLERLTSSTTEQTATVYICRGVGLFLGSLVLGPLFDRFSHNVLLAASMGVVGVTEAAIPHSNKFVIVCSLFGIQGVGVGAASVGTTLVLVKHWEKRSAPFLQAMYLMYTVAGLLSPFIINPFTMRINDDTASVTSLKYTDDDVTLNVSRHLGHISDHVTNNISVYVSDAGPSTLTLGMDRNSTKVISVPDIRYPHAITSGFILIVVIFSVAMAFYHRTFKSKWFKSKTESGKRSCGRKRIHVDIHNALRVLMFTVLLTLEMAVEVAFSGLYVSFLVRQLQWRQSSAVYASSVLFFIYGVSRLVAIPVSRFVPSTYLVMCSCILSTVGLFTMATLLSLHHSVIWVSIVLVSVAFSTVYPSTLNWASTQVKVTGGVTSIFITPLATGAVVGTTVVAYFFGHYGPMWFTYMLCLYIVLIDIMWVVAFIVTKKCPYRQENVIFTSAEPELEQEEEPEVPFLKTKADEAGIPRHQHVTEGKWQPFWGKMGCLASPTDV